MRAPHHQYTWKEYASLSGESNVKLEFLDGEIYAMAGATPEHVGLAGGVLRELFRQLEGKPCRPYAADLRIRAAGLGTYPDVSVICGELQAAPDDRNTILNPTLVVEILSPSTESYDRGDKFERYRQLGTLQEYVLVSYREPLVEVFRRDVGAWPRIEARLGGQVTLDSIGCVLSVESVYRGVSLGR